MKPSLIGMTTEELVALAQRLGQSAFRGRQLASWVYKKQARSLGEMTDLPAAFRASLAQEVVVCPLQITTHRHSTDGVDKLLVHNGDGENFECVLLPYEDRVSCCVSTQIGCPMACTFCATGMGGFDRNLTASEIVGQYLLLQSLTERRVSHLVFMGMGEPLLNLEAVEKALHILHDEIGLSYRHITISTVGLVPGIERLASLDLPIHLALSLHSPLDSVRDTLMPVNHKWPVRVVVDAMKAYQAKTGRKVTFEYLLIDGVNDSPEQAAALAQLVKGFPNFVNIIPWNWVDTGHGFSRPSRQTVERFKKMLADRGVNVTERIERGHDIAAACGQLAGQHQGRFGKKLRVISGDGA